MIEAGLISAQLRCDDAQRSVHWTLLAGSQSPIVREALVPPDRLPQGPWYYLGGLKRLGSQADRRQYLGFAATILRESFHVVHGMPLAAICSRADARSYRRILPELGCRVAVLRGSLAPGTPRLERFGETGGSDDEHVILITKEGAA